MPQALFLRHLWGEESLLVHLIPEPFIKTLSSAQAKPLPKNSMITVSRLKLEAMTFSSVGESSKIIYEPQ